MDAPAGEATPGSAGAGEGQPHGGAGADPALRVTVLRSFAETVGAVLMEWLGPFQEEAADPAAPEAGPEGGSGGAATVLVFYPRKDAALTDDEVLAALPPEVRAAGAVRLERSYVPRDWVEGWKAHFRPITVGEVRIRPPWEPAPVSTPAVGAPPAAAAPVDVVINPGLGFGTGLHATTRGALALLQYEPPLGEGPARHRGPLVDAGTGSGILAIAAAKLGWGPVFAFDNDREALKAARENVEANGVSRIVEVHRADVAESSPYWFAEATVLANMTLEPVLALVRKIAHDAPSLVGLVPGGEWPDRLVVSGILAGEQERELVAVADASGFTPAQRVYEDEWVSLELLPSGADAGPEGAAPATGVPHRGAPPSGSR